jgi:plasmid stabilization system protein ParE
MKRYRVIFSNRVRAEIKEAVSYIALDSPQQAEAWGEGLIEVIYSLETMPHRCPLIPERGEFGEDLRQMLYRSYKILFSVQGDTVEILHVRHTSRSPLEPGEGFYEN